MGRLQRRIGVFPQGHRGVHLEIRNVGFSLHRNGRRLAGGRRNQRPHRRAQADHRLLRIVGRSDEHRRAARRRGGRRRRALRLRRRRRRRRALSGRLVRFRLVRGSGRRGRGRWGRRDALSDLRRRRRRGGFRRFDGRLDRQVLRFLTHQDRSARHRQDHAKRDCRCNPQPRLRLAVVKDWRDRALAFEILSRASAGAVDLAWHFRRRGRLHWFVRAGRDNRRRRGGMHLVDPGRPSRLGEIVRRRDIVIPGVSRPFHKGGGGVLRPGRGRRLNPG